MSQIAREFNAFRQEQFRQRIESDEPYRSTIEMLTDQNERLRAWKRKAEQFLEEQGLALPPD